MSALSPEQRALLELAHDRGLTDEEIGELTGIGADEARRRVRAAEAASRRVPLLLVGVLAGLALLAGALALAGAFSGDGEESAPAVVAPAAPEGEDIARIDMRAVGGSSAQGVVGIGVADEGPYLDLDLTGIEPASGKAFHMLWIDIGDGRGVPLPDPIAVAPDGGFRERITLAPEAAGILEFASGVEVVLTNARAIKRVTDELARAERTSGPGELDPSDLPRRPGEAVLSGRVS